MGIELYEDQKKAVEKLSNGKILLGGVGSGKTPTSLVYFWEKVCGGVVGDMGSAKTPRHLFVITTAKKRNTLDWQGDAAKLGIGPDPSCSAGGIKLTVDSWNNINKYEDVKDAFFIFDEQKVVGAGAWSKAFINIGRANQWILLSATPGDTWLDYIPVMVANGWYKNRTAFKNEHVIYASWSKYPKVERYVGVGKLVKYRNHLLVRMEDKRHTKRFVKNVAVQYDEADYHKATVGRWHVFEHRPLRDAGEMFLVMRKVVNSHVSRLDAVRELMARHPKLIVFYNFDYELEALRGLEGEVPLSEWNGHKHQEIPDTDRWVYLVQYTAGAEGWNCIETDAMCLYSLTYSYKVFEQVMGRIDRINTPFTNLFYYVLVSKSTIDRAIAGALFSKESFNEKKSRIVDTAF